DPGQIDHGVRTRVIEAALEEWVGQCQRCGRVVKRLGTTGREMDLVRQPLERLVADRVAHPAYAEVTAHAAHGADHPYQAEPRQGGEARRLTTGSGEEYGPRFSPDGSMIAFTGQYEGNSDVYVVPATGGVPKRLTYHPDDDEVVGWAPGGRILFRSTRSSVS